MPPLPPGFIKQKVKVADKPMTDLTKVRINTIRDNLLNLKVPPIEEGADKSCAKQASPTEVLRVRETVIAAARAGADLPDDALYPPISNGDWHCLDDRNTIKTLWPDYISQERDGERIATRGEEAEFVAVIQAADKKIPQLLADDSFAGGLFLGRIRVLAIETGELECTGPLTFQSSKTIDYVNVVRAELRQDFEANCHEALRKAARDSGLDLANELSL